MLGLVGLGVTVIGSVAAAVWAIGSAIRENDKKSEARAVETHARINAQSTAMDTGFREIRENFVSVATHEAVADGLADAQEELSTQIRDLADRFNDHIASHN